ncbi:MAG: hypothetical protein NTX88_03610 [Candidatus Atribacteria bacterium]|nr:hypothetical protein [Candidatus Atribacteria bacterium]
MKHLTCSPFPLSFLLYHFHPDMFRVAGILNFIFVMNMYGRGTPDRNIALRATCILELVDGRICKDIYPKPFHRHEDLLVAGTETNIDRRIMDQESKRFRQEKMNGFIVPTVVSH